MGLKRILFIIPLAVLTSIAYTDSAIQTDWSGATGAMISTNLRVLTGLAIPGLPC